MVPCYLDDSFSTTFERFCFCRQRPAPMTPIGMCRSALEECPILATMLPADVPRAMLCGCSGFRGEPAQASMYIESFQLGAAGDIGKPSQAKTGSYFAAFRQGLPIPSQAALLSVLASPYTFSLAATHKMLAVLHRLPGSARHEHTTRAAGRSLGASGGMLHLHHTSMHWVSPRLPPRRLCSALTCPGVVPHQVWGQAK